MRQNQDNYDYQLNIILAGDIGVGKTKLIMKFCNTSFTGRSPCSDSLTRTLNVDENIIKFNMWDNDEAEEYMPLNRLPFRKANGIILAYDITNRESFANLKKWHKEVKENIRRDIVKMIVGTKADLKDKRAVSIHEAKDFADELGYGYIEISTETGMDVETLFVRMARKILDKMQPIGNNNEIVAIGNPEEACDGLRECCDI